MQQLGRLATSGLAHFHVLSIMTMWSIFGAAAAHQHLATAPLMPICPNRCVPESALSVSSADPQGIAELLV